MIFGADSIETIRKFYISKRTWFDKGIVTVLAFIFVVLVVVALVLILLNVYKFPL